VEKKNETLNESQKSGSNWGVFKKFKKSPKKKKRLRREEQFMGRDVWFNFKVRKKRPVCGPGDEE